MPRTFRAAAPEPLASIVRILSRAVDDVHTHAFEQEVNEAKARRLGARIVEHDDTSP
ncbi:MAG: hypothetical protein ABI134_23145 [Byssovorax sp.]